MVPARPARRSKAPVLETQCHLLQLAPELKSKILKLAMGNTIDVWRLMGVGSACYSSKSSRATPKPRSATFSTTSAPTTSFTTTRSVWMLSQPSIAMSMRLAFPRTTCSEASTTWNSVFATVMACFTSPGKRLAGTSGVV